MPKAIWRGKIIAEAAPAEVKTVEGNPYFPPRCVRQEYLRESPHHTTCHWKGVASYYHVLVYGELNENAAWHYPSPLPAAKGIAGYVAFWHGVDVVTD